MTAHAGGASLTPNPSSYAPPGQRQASAERARLRREMKARRGELPERESEAAARLFARHLSPLLRPGKRIAVYIKHGHEADTSTVIELARRRGCILYLPAITSYRHHHMRFLRFDGSASLHSNRYGILEPDPGTASPLRPQGLDLVLLPVVAFDMQGWRLGSGAGFYDRHLHHLRAGRRWRKPKLVGIAYEFQSVPRLEPAPWDVPLDAVVTERGLQRLRRPPDIDPILTREDP